MPFRIILSKIVFLAFGLRFIFAQVDVIGDQNFLFIQNNNEINLPYFSNQSLDFPNAWNSERHKDENSDN